MIDELHIEADLSKDEDMMSIMSYGVVRTPALALLLAGPAISLPNMLVIHSVLGTRKTSVFIFLVVVTATLSGFFYGQVF